MSLYRRLVARAEAENPIRVGLIGAGKFATMFLAQVPSTPGLHIAAITDLQPEAARRAIAAAGWPLERVAAPSIADAVRTGGTFVGDDAIELISATGVEVIIDATGDPVAGVRHALACAEHGKHVVMVNVEADVLAGPLLAERVSAAGKVYSLAYGDQPALIAELVDWARSAGLEIAAAGKGTKYLPGYHASTPDTVWEHYGLTAEQAVAGGMNPRMFNSFLDGTKSAIEMAAVANATGLAPAPDGLAFLPCGVHDLPRVLRPAAEGGALHHMGQVEVISSEERDGRHVTGDLRWGVYVTFRAPTDYATRCFREYGLVTDPDGRYSAMYKPFHLIGLELGLSVASIVLRGEATGAPTGFRGDAVAIAKRDLTPGEVLDGEGGHTVWARLMPATHSLAIGGLPIGLAHGARLIRSVASNEPITRDDVQLDESDDAVRIRREMETVFAPR